MVPDPAGPDTNGKYGPDVVCTEALMHRKTDNRNVAETVHPTGCGHPQVALSVFQKAFDGISREAMRAGKTIHVAIVNPVNSTFVSANPQCVMPIQVHADNPQRTAVECRRDQCFPGAIRPSLQAQPAARVRDPGPDRSIRSGSEGVYSSKRYIGCESGQLVRG